jgi:hypothetical protein
VGLAEFLEAVGFAPARAALAAVALPLVGVDTADELALINLAGAAFAVTDVDLAQRAGLRPDEVQTEEEERKRDNIHMLKR